MNSAANILVIRHETCTSLGLLGHIAQMQACQVEYLDLFLGMSLTSPISTYSHIVILGGGVSAYDDDRYSFLRDEFRLVEEAIAHHIPIVGICLGSQILAKVLGANVYRGDAGREAGWCQVNLTAAASADPVLHKFPAQFQVFQSHQDTFDIPATAVRLAESDQYPNQAFRYGDRVWALQFHLEFDQNVLLDCSALIEQELRESNIQDTTVEQLLAEATHHSPAVAPIANQFMQAFLQLQAPVALV